MSAAQSSRLSEYAGTSISNAVIALIDLNENERSEAYR